MLQVSKSQTGFCLQKGYKIVAFAQYSAGESLHAIHLGNGLI